MKIGILETGILNEKLASDFDPYPVMFEGLLGRAGRDLEYKTYSPIRGEFPQSALECEGWLITGSRHGAYEKLDWMLDLEKFIREIRDVTIPLVGICFGHQLIAQALGGEVNKSARGWGIGLQDYSIDHAHDWMGKAGDQIGIYAFHQDQVEKLPNGTEVFLSSDFCPYAGLSYGDSIISIQAHPEFEESYELALLEIYGGNIVPQVTAEEALGYMRDSGRRADTQILADWLADFFLRRRK